MKALGLEQYITYNYLHSPLFQSLVMMNTIPLEIFHEIFSRLPVKSIGKCRCVSEQWRSILCNADFTELFLTKSSALPSLLFAMERSGNNNEFLFFSSSQLDDKLSSLAASVQFKVTKDMPLELCGHASGLFCLRSTPTMDEKEEYTEYTEHVICHPSTGQYGFLPTVTTRCTSFLGFDPIDKIFKVVSSSSTYSSCSNVLNVFTLGPGEDKWRKIKSPLAHYPVSLSEGICINGVLYYLARGHHRSFYIVCFDVRSEKVKFMPTEFKYIYDITLINYEGKLGMISWRFRDSMLMWVLEDVDKHDWSEHIYSFSDDTFSDIVSVVGVTATGEIVLMSDYSNPFYVFYFHLRRNTVKRFEVQGFENRSCICVHAFVDHVDDLTFNMKSWQLHQDVPHRFERFN